MFSRSFPASTTKSHRFNGDSIGRATCQSLSMFSGAICVIPICLFPMFRRALWLQYFHFNCTRLNMDVMRTSRTWPGLADSLFSISLRACIPTCCRLLWRRVNHSRSFHHFFFAWIRQLVLPARLAAFRIWIRSTHRQLPLRLVCKRTLPQSLLSVFLLYAIESHLHFLIYKVHVIANSRNETHASVLHLLAISLPSRDRSHAWTGTLNDSVGEELHPPAISQLHRREFGQSKQTHWD